MLQQNSKTDSTTERKQAPLNNDPFYSEANMAELERRVANLREGKSKLMAHELIEE